MTDDRCTSDREREWEGYWAVYCEVCGALVDTSNNFPTVEEPVHRSDLITAIGPFEEVGETVGIEQGDCERCDGTVVKRYYTHPVSNVPEYDGPTPDLDDSDSYIGRDPRQDALIDTREIGRGIQEAHEFLGVDRENIDPSTTENEQ